jgi:hypothetical protein
MIEINLTDRELTDYQLYRFDEYISDICEYLKTHMDDKIKPFPHIYYSCKNDVIPMIRFYPTRPEHSLKHLGQFVDHIVDQIYQYNDEIDKMPPLSIKDLTSIARPSYIIPVLLPKIGTHGNEMLIYDGRTNNTTISKLINYYESLKQGDDKMIALVYAKMPITGFVASEILPYEVKYFKDDDSWMNVSIEFIDVFTNKKCVFEFKGDKIMGINIKENTSEGAAFEQALSFADKKNRKSKVYPKKVHAHEQVEETRDRLLYYERLSNIVNCCVFDCNLCKDVTFKTIDEQLFVWLCSLLNMIVLTKNTDVNLELIKNACEHLHSNGNLTDVYGDILRCIKDIELCR